MSSMTDDLDQLDKGVTGFHDTFASRCRGELSSGKKSAVFFLVLVVLYIIVKYSGDEGYYTCEVKRISIYLAMFFGSRILNINQPRIPSEH